MIIKMLKNGNEIGDVLYFSISDDLMLLRDIRFNKGTIFRGDEEFEIKVIPIPVIHTWEEKIFKCKMVSSGLIRLANNLCSCEHMKCTFEEQKPIVKEDHAGQIYNPYTDSWSWF